MNSLNSADYYAARERCERDLADGASNPIVAAIHRDMAERYAQLIQPASILPRVYDKLTVHADRPQISNKTARR